MKRLDAVGGKRLPGPATRPRATAQALPNRTSRQARLAVLAAIYGRSYKEVAVGAGFRSYHLSKSLKKERQKELPDDVYEKYLTGLGPIPETAEPLAGAFVEAMYALEDEKSGLTPGERAAVELELLDIVRRLRPELGLLADLSREAPADEYPTRWALAPARRRAEAVFARLAAESAAVRPAIVRNSELYQTWALCERVCAASVEAASQDLEAAAAWARLAVDLAERVRGPEDFRRRVRGYAAAHLANVLRVAGDLNAADAAFADAERLWLAGHDPAAVLDPGRLLDLEASLRRAQRRPEKALALLEEALEVGRSRARLLVNKGFTLEVMGDYQGAMETLLEALPRAERRGDPRLLYMARFNLAVVETHLGCHDAAAALLPQVRELAADLGDAIFLNRVLWLEGRIFAGLGRPREARRLLAAARRGFQSRGMSYDAALALLEEAALLLEEGRAAEVRPLARELAAAFRENGVHREALAALRLFARAAERAEATAELARNVLRFLFRARHDPGLRFES